MVKRVEYRSNDIAKQHIVHTSNGTRILPVRKVIHHSFATIHPYINTHLTLLIDWLVKCDELSVNMIGGTSRQSV